MAYCGPSGTAIVPFPRARGERSPVIEWSLRMLWPYLVAYHSRPRWESPLARPGPRGAGFRKQR